MLTNSLLRKEKLNGVGAHCSNNLLAPWACGLLTKGGVTNIGRFTNIGCTSVYALTLVILGVYLVLKCMGA